MATSTIIGSANMELEQAFRMMALELGQQLSQGECQQIAYVSSCVDEPAPPGYDYRLYVFSTLESRGQIGPLKLDFIEEVLVHIGRKDLLSIIAKYKRKPIYKEMHSKKKPKGRMKQKKNQTMQSATPTDSTQYEEMYACFLTQYSTIALRMRSALESNDIAQMKYAFSSIANDGDAIARMLRKKLSIHVGVNRDSSSSRESSGCTSLTWTESPSPGYLELKSTPENPTPAITEPQLARSTLPMQVSSPPPSNKTFIFPRSTSASKFNSEDYTQSGGTGDSGVGDINHTPSKEALQQIDPAAGNIRSDQDDRYRNYREGYMPLMFSEVPEAPNEYTMVKFDQPEINSSNQ